MSGCLAALTWCNEAETGSLALGLTRSRSVVSLHIAIIISSNHRPASHGQLPSHRGPPLHSEQAITMADTFQSARCTRLRLALRKTLNTLKKKKIIDEYPADTAMA